MLKITALKTISSVQNPLIREIIQLQERSRSRKKSGLFIIEGQREAELALKGGYHLEKILYVQDLIPRKVAEQLILNPAIEAERIEITPEVYEKIAYRGGTEGLVAVARTREHSLANLKLNSKNPLILVAEAPEKPGNIGALLRTADAAALDAVIIANPKTDLYNPNIIRSGVGCLFTNQVATGSTEEIIRYLKDHNISIYCAALTAATRYDSINFNGPAAIVVGTEATGLSEQWLTASDQNIIIPMLGAIDSMNVSVSAAIIIFEAKRQRNFDLTK